MELASCWLLLTKNGTNVPIKGVTPAELLLLVRDRQDFVGKHPIHNLVITGKSRRTAAQEKQRLKEKYGKALPNRKDFKVDLLYPGEGVALPETFASLGDVYKLSLATAPDIQTSAPDIPGIGDSEMERILRLETLETLEAEGGLSEEDKTEIAKLREFFVSKRENEPVDIETEASA